MPLTVKATQVRARHADRKLAAVALALAAALGVLGWWQYRSVREASDAERDRMRALLASRAAQFERDLDRELTRAFVWLQLDAPAPSGEPRRSVTERLARWYEESPHPELLETIYVIRTPDTGPGSRPGITTTRFDRATSALVDAALPAQYTHVVDRLAARDRDHDALPGPRRLRFGPPVDPHGPALIVGRPWFRRGRPLDHRGDAGGAAARADEPDHDVAAMVAVLGTDYLTRTLLPALAAEHFPPDERFAFRLRITRVSDGQPVFAWPAADAAVDFSRPDATVDLLRVRVEDFSRFMLTRATPIDAAPGMAAASPTGGERIEIAVLPPGAPSTPPAPGRGDAVVIGAPDGRPAVWSLALVHRDGSLDEAIARTRRWNLGAGMGMLLILAAGMGLVLVASRRAQRLAHERLEFVAGVSHELRTPLSVIRSAAENLADGVVADGPQVKRYGALIATEGRRLSSMVDDVMAFAGIEAGQGAAGPRPVAIAAVVDACLDRVAGDVAAAGITLEVSRATTLPLVAGDADALVRVLVNLVGNAAKYAADGGWIGLSVDTVRERGRTMVRMVVSDRGPGIRADERGRVFEPFFRGADAVTRQVHGNGLGLSLVQRTVAQHGGRVTLADNTPRGCVFTVVLPVAPPSALVPATLGDEAPAAR